MFGKSDNKEMVYWRQTGPRSSLPYIIEHSRCYPMDYANWHGPFKNEYDAYLDMYRQGIIRVPPIR